MSKNIIRAAFVAAFAFIAGYCVYTSQQETEMSDLAMANVEALAGGETSTSWTCIGYWGDCNAYCGSCGTKISGDGELSGKHSCN